MSKYDYLEKERIKLWEKVVEIEAALEKKTSDYEKEAQQSSKKASEFRNRSEDAKKSANEYLASIKKSHDEITQLLEEAQGLNISISELNTNCTEKLELTQSSYDNIVNLEKSILGKIQAIEEIFSEHPDFEAEIVELESKFASVEDLQNKINTLHKTALSKKNEIDELYYEIFGYTENDDQGNETHVEGMKDELSNSFEKIKNNVNDYKERFSIFKETKEQEVIDFIDNWEKKINSTDKKIKELLPKALTAGLSYAYSEKKKDEEKEGVKHSTSFNKSIGWLVVISLIPFGVNVILWLQGKELQDLILDMPRLVLAIMPLYVPLLWLAYTANKKTNLSKRLVEEYTHKEVLSKTFEGLSHQIAEIEDEGISSELRVKLIYNILNVSSENPGKLITDYNKADHPLIDALDKSVQLATAVDKLSGIPGFSKISKILEKKSKQIIADKALKAEQGLASLDNDNEDAENA